MNQSVLVRISRRLVVALSLFSLVMIGDAAAFRDRDLWILVDTEKMILSVLEGNIVRRTYDGIAIGRAGTTLDKVEGDYKTPLGDFRLVRITSNSAFHRFFGFDYPTVAHARRAYRSGAIDYQLYDAIFSAFEAGSMPPQTTPLGGHIGIHGIGQGDPSVHAEFNWTQGCIALTNQQIDDLSNWVYRGMRVVVR